MTYAKGDARNADFSGESPEPFLDIPPYPQDASKMRPLRYRPSMDVLERRDVPSAATPSTANLTAGVLTVIGSSQADAISITGSGAVMRVLDSGRVIAQVASANVKKIVVEGGFGHDNIIVGARIKVPAFLYGGFGNDLLYGGAGKDQLYGGTGADGLFGRVNNDLLFGGTGGDSLNGGGGVNTLVEGTPARVYQMNVTEQTVVAMVNVERANRGLAPLTANGTLAYAAWFHSNQMATRSNVTGNPSGAMQHYLFGVNAPTPTTRLDYAGYDNWAAWGENIAFAYNNATAVMQAWMNSEGHRANILSPNFTEIGVGMVANAAGQFYWTQVFGAP
jgi:uncharacterized protein YkwD